MQDFLFIILLFIQACLSVADLSTADTLCPSLAGSLVANTTFLNSKAFEELVFSHEQTTRTCNFTSCLESGNRAACNIAYTQAGLYEVNTASLFPFISYNSQAPVVGGLKASTPTTPTKTSLAYILLVHNKYEQTTRLIRAIYHPDNVYVIHVDKKAPSLKDELIAFAKNYSNVYVLERSYNIGWGGIDMVYATLEAMFALLDVDARWDFVINLSSQDYPLCNDEQLSSYLATRKGKNFDEAQLPPYEHEKFWRARALYVWCDQGQCYQFKERQLPFGISSYVGSQWFVYSRAFAQYLRTDRFPKLLLAHFEHTWVADESYFPTVLMNSPYKETRIANNLRYIVFAEIHPYIWTEIDYPTLVKQDACFSRKFDEGASVLNLLDQLIASGPRPIQLP